MNLKKLKDINGKTIWVNLAQVDLFHYQEAMRYKKDSSGRIPPINPEKEVFYEAHAVMGKMVFKLDEFKTSQEAESYIDMIGDMGGQYGLQTKKG